jgi:SSS family solute:Na+ symporter
VGSSPGIKGGWLNVFATFPSEMAQNFWLASFAFTSCLILTTVISLATRRTASNEDLQGLVYSLTPKIVEPDQVWYLKPSVLGSFLLLMCVGLNFLFW